MRVFVRNSLARKTPVLHRCSGFAIVTTLVLMSFVLLLLLSFTARIHVEQEALHTQKALMHSRQNALLGLNVAIGKLAWHTASDRLATGRADLLKTNESLIAMNRGLKFVSGVFVRGADPVWLLSSQAAHNTGSDLTSLVGVPLEQQVKMASFEEKGSTVSVTAGLVVADNIHNARYAWWVSDEGVKARVNHLTPAELPPSLSVSGRVTPPEDLVSYQNALEATALFRPTYESKSDLFNELPLITTPAGFELLESAGTTNLSNYHPAFTPYAASVLADAKNGGLKADLSIALGCEQSTHYFASEKQIFDAVGVTKTARNPGGPLWSQLRSFYQLAGSSTSVAPRAHTDSQMGVAPVIVNVILSIHATLTPTQDGVRLYYCPTIVLWNPYNVDLEAASYYVRWGVGEEGTGGPGDLQGGAEIHFELHGSNDSESRQWIQWPGSQQIGAPYIKRPGDLVFKVNSAGIPAGKALIYAPARQSPLVRLFAGASPNILQQGYNSGFGFYEDLHYSDMTYRSDVNEGGNVGLPSFPNSAEIKLHTENPFSAINIDLALSLSELDTAPLQSLSRLEAWAPWDAAPQYLLPDAISDTESLYALLSTTSFPIITYRHALKLLSNNYSAPNRAPSQWISHNNPRAPVGGRSPLDFATPDYSGGYNTHPGYDGGRDTPGGNAHFIQHYGDNAFIGTTDAAGKQTCVLFDIPQDGQWFTSVGMLMHANLSHYNGNAENARENWVHSNYSPAYAIGNSLADPRIPDNQVYRNSWDEFNSVYHAPGVHHYDYSYYLNNALWDPYFFSTIPEFGPLPKVLVNSRLQPIENAISDTLLGAIRRDPDLTAEHFLLNGGFNINSTLTAAWEAFFLSMYNRERPGEVGDLHYGRYSNTNNRVGFFNSNDSADSDTAYFGKRRVTKDEAAALAIEVVNEIKNRGPFYSLAAFINRDPDSTTKANRQSGALQAAIDTLSEAGKLNNSFLSDLATMSDYPASGGAYDFSRYEKETLEGPIVHGVPGFLTQADLLAKLGPALVSRSDTFLVRGYGEAVSPFTGKVNATAYCEAVVQRLPEWDGTGTNRRKLKIIHFQWLGEL